MQINWTHSASPCMLYKPHETSFKSDFHLRKRATLKTDRLTRAPPDSSHSQRLLTVWTRSDMEGLLATQMGIPPPDFPEINQDISPTPSHGHGHWLIWPNCEIGAFSLKLSWCKTFKLLTLLLFEDESPQRAVFRWMVLLGLALVSSSLALARPSPAPSHGPHPPHWVLNLTLASELWKVVLWAEPYIWMCHLKTVTSSKS